MSDPKQNLLLIAGCHRSGTSVLSGVFGQLGFGLPRTLMPGGKWNEKGYFESKVFEGLHSKILEYIERPVFDFRATDPRTDFGRIAEDRAEALDRALEHEFNSAYHAVLKDPRICRLLPMWRAFAETTHRSINVVIPLRNPLEVASSLRRRDGFSIPEGLLIWVRETTLAILQSQGLPRTFVLYQDLLNDWARTMDQAAKQLGIELPTDDPTVALSVEELVSKDLQHFSGGPMLLGEETWIHLLADRLYGAVRHGLDVDAEAGMVGVLLDAGCEMMPEVHGPSAQVLPALTANTPAVRTLEGWLNAGVIASAPEGAAQLKRMEQDVQSFRDARAQAEQRATDHAEKQHVLEDTIRRLKTETSELKVSLEDRYDEIGELLTTIETLQSELSDLKQAAKSKK